MKEFAELVYALGTTTKTNEKLQALMHYFSVANDKDKVWVIALFSGRRPRRTISGRLLRDWCSEVTNLPGWLIDECYLTVGDLGETISLLFDQVQTPQEVIVSKPLHTYIEELASLETAGEEARREFMIRGWMELSTNAERYVFNKLLSGTFRIGVSQQLMVNALAKLTGEEPGFISHRLIGSWDPYTITFAELLHNEHGTDDSKPYPFYLAYALETEPESLGAIEDWQIEWKWDGIRGQIVKRNGQLFVWSRGEDLMTDRLPEFEVLKEALPDGTVLDGEIIVAKGSQPMPFALMQTRIGRKRLDKKILEQAPVGFFSYDLLEWQGKDMRQTPLQERRALLENIVANVPMDVLQISPVVQAPNWEALTEMRLGSRENFAEGFMLKRRESVYQSGRKRGDWWKWKIDPLVIDCVMIYAQKGSGRRSNLYTDYTFAVRDGDQLVPFAKAYSGLTDKEIARVDNFVKRNALEKFGPVRTVKPELVFELAFEGIAESKRHKSGVAIRFPRINRWREDKKPDEINTLDDLKAMLKQYGSGDR